MTEDGELSQELLDAITAIRAEEELVPEATRWRRQSPSEKKSGSKGVDVSTWEWFGRIHYVGVNKMGGQSSKFWECRVSRVYPNRWRGEVRYGKIGSAGVIRTVGSYETRVAAIHDLQRRRWRKLKAGYFEVNQ